MKPRHRRTRGLLLIPIFGGIFWATALLASTVPGLLVLGVNVHGLGIASYAGDAGGSLAPLSPKILYDVNQDTSQKPASTASAGPGSFAGNYPGGSSTVKPSETPAGASTPGPSPTPTPTPAGAASPTPAASPSPSVLPLPTVTPLPSVLPTPSATPTPTPTPGRATINGQVVDIVTHLGIPGAQVMISSGGSTLADANGNFNFAVIAGSYTLTASATGYSSASQAVTVNGGQNLAVTIKLTSVTATGGIKGFVTSSSTAAAIVGAVVTLSNGLATVTDITGAYSFPAVLYGNYTATATATGYVAQSQPLSVKPGHTTTLNFSLTP